MVRFSCALRFFRYKFCDTETFVTLLVNYIFFVEWKAGNTLFFDHTDVNSDMFKLKR